MKKTMTKGTMVELLPAFNKYYNIPDHVPITMLDIARDPELKYQFDGFCAGYTMCEKENEHEQMRAEIDRLEDQIAAIRNHIYSGEKL